jgi:hypothetical protein
MFSKVKNVLGQRSLSEVKVQSSATLVHPVFPRFILQWVGKKKRLCMEVSKHILPAIHIPKVPETPGIPVFVGIEMGKTYFKKINRPKHGCNREL